MIRPHFALATALLACSALAAPAPKPQPFVTGWAKPIDPDGDCKVRRDKDALIIEMPGSDHDYNPLLGQLNAPRLFRDLDLEGDFVMQVRVRIESRPSVLSTVAGQPSVVSAGFLIVLPDDAPLACIRMEFGVCRKGDGVESYFDGRKWPKNNSQAEAEAAAVGVNNPLRKNRLSGKVLAKGWKGDPYMRLERQDGDLSISISSDVKTWKVLATVVGTREKLKVGLATYSTSSEPSKIQFDQFKLTVARKKKR